MVKITVKYKKLGRNKSWGLAHVDKSLVEIDTRAEGKKHLEILTHESLHILCPYLSEEEIVRISAELTHVLWDEKYRRIDNTNNTLLQDGTQ